MCKICIDKPIFQNISFIPSISKSYAIGELNSLWEPGTVLSVYFIDGTQEQHDRMSQAFIEWEKHCSIKFSVTDDPNSMVRIKWKFGDGAWSYIGKSILSVPKHLPTMNIGFVEKGIAVELHEVGHTLGLLHEHQNPQGGIIWNEENVISDLSGPPNNWTLDQINHNVLNKKLPNSINNIEFDPDSIMLYAFPDSWTMNNKGTDYNMVLSENDKITINEFYPNLNKEEPDVPTPKDPLDPLPEIDERETKNKVILGILILSILVSLII